TFLCLDRIPRSLNHAATPPGSGIVGWAHEHMSVDHRFEHAFRFLLDGTMLVDDLTTARRVLEQEPGIRCVTLDGEIITSGGVVRGGSVRQDEGGHIGRRSQLAELRKEIADLERQRADLRSDIDRLSHEMADIDVRKLVEEAKAIEMQMTTVEIRIAQLEFEKKRAAENVEKSDVEVVRLQEEIARLTGELERVLPDLERLDREKTEAERLSGAAASELETMEALWNEFARVAQEASVRVLTLKGEERSIQQEIEHITSTIHSLAGAFEQRTADIASARDEIERLGVEIAESDRALAAAREEMSELRGRKRGADEELIGKRSQVHGIELKLKDERLRHEGSLKSAHDLEIKIQELTMKSENLKTKAKEEFEIELELRDYPDNESFDFAGAREEARMLKEKLRGLGAVNFAAFDEYKSEKERLDFVNAQRQDLQESETTLLATIEEINTTAQRKFLETFELIRE
ncbi:MAG: hypothetical protein WD295_00890, partial [Bacteroidota bacterium]